MCFSRQPCCGLHLNTRPAGRGQGPIKTQQCGFVQQEVFPEVPFGELPCRLRVFLMSSEECFLFLFFPHSLCVHMFTCHIEAKDIFIYCSLYLGFVLPRQAL